MFNQKFAQELIENITDSAIDNLDFSDPTSWANQWVSISDGEGVEIAVVELHATCWNLVYEFRVWDRNEKSGYLLNTSDRATAYSWMSEVIDMQEEGLVF